MMQERLPLMNSVGRWAAARGLGRALIVADAFNARRVDVLGLAGDTTVFGEVEPEPSVPNLEKLLAAAEAARPGLVVGFGGGSAMDLAKLAAVLLGSGQTIAEVVGPERVQGRRCTLVQVPTTSGTGSEAGTRALVTDPSTRSKLAVQSRHMLADLAVIDPDLTLTVLAQVTAATGVDALAHCAEAFTSRKAHPLVDHHALEGIRLVGRYLARAVADGGVCLGPVTTTAGHAVAYPLGTRHHIPHGAACALIFPHALAFNAPVTRERTAAILKALQLEVAGDDERAVRAAAHRFCANLGLEMHLSRLGVPEEDLDAMADEAHAIRRLLDNNPREISRDEILAMYRAAF
jgi:alcohol dehydrogenase class IV